MRSGQTIRGSPPRARRCAASIPSVEPLLVRMGGTLPAASMLAEELRLDTVFFSFSSGDENLHAPNEFFRLARLREGQEAWRHLLELLAAS